MIYALNCLKVSHIPSSYNFRGNSHLSYIWLFLCYYSLYRLFLQLPFTKETTKFCVSTQFFSYIISSLPHAYTFEFVQFTVLRKKATRLKAVFGAYSTEHMPRFFPCFGFKSSCKPCIFTIFNTATQTSSLFQHQDDSTC